MLPLSRGHGEWIILGRMRESEKLESFIPHITFTGILPVNDHHAWVMNYSGDGTGVREREFSRNAEGSFDYISVLSEMGGRALYKLLYLLEYAELDFDVCNLRLRLCLKEEIFYLQ